MQVDNQTLITIIKETIRSSITPDYVGWGIGIGQLLIENMLTVSSKV